MPRLAHMANDKAIWLAVNARSGSNSAAALDALRQSLESAGYSISREICFPDDSLPTPEELDRAGIETLAVFTGDGTLNAAVTGLYGWGGAVLVLPGGTMNLLCQRLHGDADADTIITRVAAGAARKVRPIVVRCEAGDATAGLLAGPGTAWASVREAMRDFDIAGIAQGATEAVSEVTGGAMMRCADPPLGRSEGYPLIEMTPSHRGIQVDAYHAEGAGEVLQQSWALLRRRFREGPHTRLGLLDRFRLESTEGEAIEVLIDGEPATLGRQATFSVAPCEVDLLATQHGF